LIINLSGNRKQGRQGSASQKIKFKAEVTKMKKSQKVKQQEVWEDIIKWIESIK
jgi:hypothetical protein